MRVIQPKLNRRQEIEQLMRGIRVDPYGIKIMLPKAVSCLLKLNAISNIKANILKQEMLSLGGDAAIARQALTGQDKTTDCLLMGSLAQFRGLNEKLSIQPFGLKELADELTQALDNYSREDFRIALGKYKLDLPAGRVGIMGVLNLTPDSFSGDGLSSAPIEKVVDMAAAMAGEGADIIDIGGVSSRPGAAAVSVKEELRRVMPALKIIAKKINLPVSIDTCRPLVARRALDEGAVMVNDICGLRDRKMIRTVARCRAAVVIMHMRGVPRTMQKGPRYNSVVEEVIDHLAIAVDKAVEAGIDREKIIIDPGFGFGKTLEHNLEILRRLEEFKVLGRPILAGVSRKSFIGKILGVDVADRLYGTLSASVAAVRQGAKFIRVHDVRAASQAMRVLSAIDKA